MSRKKLDMSKQIILSKDIDLGNTRFHFSIITLAKNMTGFPCSFRIRFPKKKKSDRWLDITIANRMFSIGWL